MPAEGGRGLNASSTTVASSESLVETSVGAAVVTVDVPRSPVGLVALGHGAGGGIEARDLVAVRDAGIDAGYAVARVTQPYRVAGRRGPAPAHQLDAAFTETVAALGGRPALSGLPLVVGGRSSGARVACRTADAIGACGVLALAFPLHPPGRPELSRLDELVGVRTPVLVVQGERDRFGSPDDVVAAGLPPRVRVRVVPGADHGLAHRKRDPDPLPAAMAAITRWLDARTRRPSPPAPSAARE